MNPEVIKTLTPICGFCVAGVVGGVTLLSPNITGERFGAGMNLSQSLVIASAGIATPSIMDKKRTASGEEIRSIE